MKRVRKILLASVIFCTISGQVTYASATTEENTPIIIDGIYSDWDGIPNCIDKESDSDKKSEDLKEIKYYVNKDYLYLYIERFPSHSGEYPDSGLWDMWIPIINGNGNGSHNCFFPWDTKEGEVWHPQKVSTFKITCGFVELWDSESGSMVKKFNIRIKLDGNSVGEDRLFTNSDGSKIEIRLPLSIIGLNGDLDEVEFNVASDIHASNEFVDWANDDGPIVVTKVSIFGKLTTVVALSGFLGVALVAKKKIERHE
ncbi:MAG: hypothetical protein E6860_01745 [Clostridium sp.]|uniref:hypothetical protein n=1 Tax=Clostridium sp. TaxID=1506 RepID=UPI0028FE4EC9|nr:hypothetical protein [Clostridium sp.]MDU1584249.1 hypothetical protein [Clostridium sp.]MDU1976977.1 hypothetical protein [Clostridium sp.]MDU1992544.1 hypothetical protein [Clostridium sp.]MDU6047090.1 hypothetical protein [Clostridium sp.]MDU6220612.1 hypothetical protein [Clostridium sp.]